MNGHSFTEKPDMVNTCVGCHSSRGGHAYMGVASGTVPDVHLSKAGFKCTNCHSKDEIHGTGKFVEQRYKYDKLPKCIDCHQGLENDNPYHSNHYTTFSCNTCHSQSYNNCGSCHIHGDGARIASYQDFKIGMNPIPDAKPGLKFALLRRTLMAPDSWEKYGVSCCRILMHSQFIIMLHLIIFSDGLPEPRLKPESPALMLVTSQKTVIISKTNSGFYLKVTLNTIGKKHLLKA